MPSLHEGLSMLSMEASMNGVPVVESGCPGLGETLPPDWPLVSRENSAAAYARCFAVPEERRKALADETRRYAEAHFTMRLMGQAYERLYRDKCSKAD